MIRIQISCLVAAFVAGAAAPAAAQPAEVPIQGTLTDAEGAPLTGDQRVEVRLYTAETGGEPLFEETHLVSAENGAFTLYLGSVSPLSLDVFDGRQLYVGLTVGDDDEMTPRLPLGTVPYAAHAATTSVVPTGAVMHFDLESCPAGWSELEAARGRSLVGTPEAGTQGATVGTALGDQENRAHNHNVDIDPFNSGSASASHTHSVNPPSQSTTSDSHNHQWFDEGLSFLEDGTQIPVFPVGLVTGEDITRNLLQAGQQLFSDSDAHAHSVNIPSFTSGGSSSTSHDHAVDPPSAASTAATTGNVMPYMQLLTCRKD